MERQQSSSPPVLFARREQESRRNSCKSSGSRAMNAFASVAMCFVFTLAVRSGQSLSSRTLLKTPHVMDGKSFWFWKCLQVFSNPRIMSTWQQTKWFRLLYSFANEHSWMSFHSSRAGLIRCGPTAYTWLVFRCRECFEFGIGEMRQMGEITSIRLLCAESQGTN